MIEDHPVNNVIWVPISDVEPNDYNPNSVAGQEMKLLHTSIKHDGYTQPIVTIWDGEKEKYVIVDGFHRVQLSLDNEKIYKKYKGQVPCVVFAIARDKAMILTVRMNRAKGNHVAWRMAEMVKELIDYFDYEPRALAKAIGGTKAEIDLLYTEGVFEKKDIANYKYSKSWYPSLVEDVDADNK